jgi:subtilisin family serine protease
MPGRGLVGLLIAAALFAAAVGPAAAATLPPAPAAPRALAGRMDSGLAALAGGQASLRQAARGDGLTVRDGRVVVLVLSAPNRTGEATAAIGRAGGIVDAATAGSVEAEVAPAELGPLSRGPGVRYLEAMVPDVPAAVPGQGVGKSGAATAQSAGVNGQGVKVAVIDNGFTGYQDSQASGDIPANAITQNFCSGGFDGGTITKHGTGVAEIVSEMAPGAQLYLICAGNAPELTLAEQYAVSQGIAIVNRSESNFVPAVRGDGSGGPGTEDATVEDARNNGILWVNSAGNFARIHWGGPFTDADGNGFLEWVPGDETNTISLPSGAQVCIAMKWDDWPTTSQNFDVGLYSGPALVAGSADVQSGSQPPSERFCYTNPGATAPFDIRVHNQSGGVPGTHIDLFIYNEGVGSISRPVAPGSVSEPATAPEAFAVGAVCPLDDSLLSYSSQGPTIDGRVKPDIAGYAPVDSASYGPAATDACTGGFSGTSAASPHVAGAAALYKQVQPGASPDQLRDLLERSAADLGSPGKDNQFGAGELKLQGIPDLLIRSGKTTVGDGVYAGSETAKRKVRAGRTARFALIVQNDGALPASFELDASRARKLIAVFSLKGKNVSKKIVKGKLKLAVMPGASRKISLAMKTKPGTHGKHSVKLSASNVADRALDDKVGAKLKIG